MISRKFNAVDDFNKLQAFLFKMRQHNPVAFFHYGDLMFRIHKASNDFRLDDDIRIWEIDDEIVGFVFYTSVEANPDYMINPDYYHEVFSDAVTWSLKRAGEENEHEVETGCIEGDKLKEEYLLNAGFKSFDDPFVCLSCKLENWFRTYQLPQGYELKTASEAPDLYGITHIEDKEAYDLMIQSPGYRDDLGIRVVYKNNDIAAGCICWLDENDGTAIFEPVGTVAEHRKKGLSYAVMAEVMSRLKCLGVTTVYVKTSGKNLPAIGLYKKLGFDIVGLDLGYYKMIDGE